MIYFRNEHIINNSIEFGGQTKHVSTDYCVQKANSNIFIKYN